MPVLIKTESKGCTPEWAIVELQGDLQVRDNEHVGHQFIGDLNYDKYGEPIFIIGHHILHGKEQTLEKPFAVMEKIELKRTTETDDDNDGNPMDTTDANNTINRTALDSTIAVENKFEIMSEYRVRALVRKKLIFKTRPRPIIANIAKTV